MTTRIFEAHDASYGAYFEATEVLETVRSDFQEIQVIDTAVHGRVMLIDGLTMLTDDTHFVYHEHMAHIPAMCVDQVRDVLVIGGGDGGVVTELVKYQDIETITLAELDGAVIDVSRRWFPAVCAGLDDPRVRVEIGDGAAYLAGQGAAAFDLVIIDSTDICEEVTHTTDTAFPLATDAFFESLKTGLRPGGAAVQVLGHPVFYKTGMAKLLPRLAGIWPNMGLISMATPFYITGSWVAGLYAVDGRLDPRHAERLPKDLSYINADTARAALAQPNFLTKLMKG
ncbi:MAG: hypothetical protein PVI23_09750 [Maricaulaceae bacterium]|jgi:spermidine synthase